VLAIVAPGQGAQTPGFLTPWLELPAAADLLRLADEVTGMELVRLGTEGSAEEIRDTAVAQPLLVAAALASAAALELLPFHSATGATATAAEGTGVRIFAGHSVGELPAAVLAGALSPVGALRLAATRGRAMADACAAADTGMIAVLGGEPDAVDAALAAAGLIAANRNGAGQVVAAGPRAALDALAADPPARARLRPLEVAGAFHTEAMRPAQRELDEYVRPSSGRAVAQDPGAGIEVTDPRSPLLSNADGAVVSSGAELLDRLVAQVAAPVRWDLCMQTMLASGVSALIELASGGTLTGLAKRAMRGVETVALRDPGDLEAAQALLKRFGAGSRESEGQAFGDGVAP
jgi:[acyl-carrier-protein] S-malonyltransferase